MPSASEQEETLTKVNFAGGYPTSSDLSPSIVFLVVYALLVPILVIRLIRKSDRTWVLLRPTVFILCRLAMLALRAYMSRNVYNTGSLITELVLVSIGFLFLIDPVCAIWKRHVDSVTPIDQRPRWVSLFFHVLRILIITAIVTTIAGSSLIPSAFDKPVILDTVKVLRRVSAIFALTATVILLIAIVRAHIAFPVSRKGTMYVLAETICLMVIAIYRTEQTFSTGNSNSTGARTAFWISQMLFELIAFILLIVISIPTWFPGDVTSPSTDAELGLSESSFETMGLKQDDEDD